MKYTRYKNRKIYCFDTKSYVGLEVVLADERAVVVCNKTKCDITDMIKFAAIYKEFTDKGQYGEGYRRLNGNS